MEWNQRPKTQAADNNSNSRCGEVGLLELERQL